MKRPELSLQEDRARRVLAVAMRLLDVNDGQLAERLNWTRQRVEQRRSGATRIRMGDVDALAQALEINPLVFSLEPVEAARYVLDKHSDLLIRSWRCIAA